MARVTAPDLELWLTGYVRGVLAAEGVTAQVSNKEPGDLVLPLAKPLVVIRDDSGVRLSHVTYDRSVGVSVLAGTRTNDKLAGDLARLVMAILTDDAIVEAVGLRMQKHGPVRDDALIEHSQQVIEGYGPATVLDSILRAPLAPTFAEHGPVESTGFLDVEEGDDPELAEMRDSTARPCLGPRVQIPSMGLW